MADKKRQKWIREKGKYLKTYFHEIYDFYILAEIEKMQLEIEYDQLKHQLSPRHKKNPTSPRIT